MGYYLETRDRFNKADALVSMYGARIVDQLEAMDAVADGNNAVICVVRNNEFEAAAFCFDLKEYKRFTNPGDPRARTWVVIDGRELVEELTGYAEDMAKIGEEE